MTDRELRKLNRKDLLEVLLDQAKEIDLLKEENDELQRKLEDKIRHFDEVGSLAEEAVKVNGVFESAQAVADFYLDNVERTKSETAEECDRMRAETQKECDTLLRFTDQAIAEKKKRLAAYVAYVNASVNRFYEEHPELTPVSPDEVPEEEAGVEDPAETEART